MLSVCFSFHNHCTAHIFLITFNLLTSRCGYIMPCLLFPSIFVLRLHLIQTIIVQASVVSISHTSTSTLFHGVSVWDWVEFFFRCSRKCCSISSKLIKIDIFGPKQFLCSTQLNANGQFIRTFKRYVESIWSNFNQRSFDSKQKHVNPQRTLYFKRRKNTGKLVFLQR